MDANRGDDLVLPIGQRLGPYYFSDDPDEVVYRVRVGPDVRQLAADAHKVWDLAHGSPDEFDGTWTVGLVLEAAAKAGADDPKAILDDLISRCCAVVISPELESYVAFGRQHLMVPTMLGLGNSRHDPATFAIGVLGGPAATVDPTIYDIYQWSYFDTDLWSACQSAAAVNRRLEVVDPVVTEADLLLGMLTDHLHALLMARAIYLDTSRAERSLVSRLARSARETSDA